jgi:nitroreductase
MRYLQNDVFGVLVIPRFERGGVMDIFKVISYLRSNWKCKGITVEREKIEHVLNAARLAPSWMNLQCWRFLVLTDPERRASLLEAFPESSA